MIGEPREEMDIPLSDRLPPIVAFTARAGDPDAALAGEPLPPYRPGMYSGAQAKPAISELSAALEAEQEVGPPVAEGWPAAWREDPVPAEEPGPLEAEPQAIEEPLAMAEPEEPAMLFLDEAEIAPAEAERDPTGYEQAIDTQADVWAWDSDETPVYDLAPAAEEDTGPWEDAWAAAADVAEPPFDEPVLEPADPFFEPAEPAAMAQAEFGEVAQPQDDFAREPAAEGPESAGDVQEWLEGGATESYDWGVDVDEPVAELAHEEAQPVFEGPEAEPMFEATDAEPAFEPGEIEAPEWEEEGSGLEAPAEPIADYGMSEWTVEPGEESGELVHMQEEAEEDFGATLAFTPVEDTAAEAPADEAWAPFEPSSPEHEEPVAETEAAGGAGVQEPLDERVAIVPPTPMDSWYHGEHGAEAEATWEAFGRALEEAASWGDPGAAVPTGLPAAEAQAEPAASGTEEPPPADEQAEPAAAASAQDPAVTDLARRLELLARRLREEGEKGVEHALSEGDRLEASLAGFIAGYVAARRG